MGYRPLCDVMLLARPKVKYWGAYPSGFLERARALLGVSLDDCVLHVCGGKVKDYPFSGFGVCDKTVDINPDLEPDFIADITTQPLPLREDGEPWAATLCDPPYTEEDATHYGSGSQPLPSAQLCLEKSLAVTRMWGRVGVLHYVPPRPPKGVKLVALVGVIVGFNNRIRCYSVYEKR